MMTSGPRLSTPVASKPSTGNIILQVTNNDVQQSKLLDKSTIQSLRLLQNPMCFSSSSSQ